MNASEIIKNIETAQLKAEVPEFRVGDTVKVYGKIKEGNRERIQVFEGTVLKKQGGSNRETFTVRKISNGVGVEKTWPLHSPNVEKVEVVRQGKVRRAKLNYLRDRVGKAAKVKELVNKLDPQAFMIISDASEVVGQGFTRPAAKDDDIQKSSMRMPHTKNTLPPEY